MAASSSKKSNNISWVNARREYEQTLELIEELRDRKGHNFNLLSEAIRYKSNFKNEYRQHISNVQKFHSEVNQFKFDVKRLNSNQNLSQREVAEDIRSEEDKVARDMVKAAEAVIKFESLKEDAKERKEKFEEQGKDLNKIYMLDNYFIADAVLRNISYYFWNTYSDLGLYAKRIADKTNEEFFRKEFNKIKNNKKVKIAIKTIEKNYDNPDTLENNRHAALEENVSKVLDKMPK